MRAGGGAPGAADSLCVAQPQLSSPETRAIPSKDRIIMSS
jgi:hypothetical protein